MKKDELEVWQKYFTSNEIKQPFAQVWEPIVDKSTIKSDRYAGFMIPLSRLRGKEKHGISVVDCGYNELRIYFDECNAVVNRKTGMKHVTENSDLYEIESFKFKNYTKMVNHIVAYLDKITILERILKNDTSITTYLSSFTLAQITEFINLAMENNCKECLATLMDYRNKKFSQCNPMDEFTLD